MCYNIFMTTDTKRLPRYYRQRAANRFSLGVLLKVLPWRREGLPLWRCCNRLNAAGETTFSGKPWTVGRLSQVLKTGRTAAETEFVKTGDRDLLRAANHVKGESQYAEK